MTPASYPKVLFTTAEVHPLIKTGGLADVSGALPTALHALGVDIKLLIPGYREVLAKCRNTTPIAQFPHPFAPGEVTLVETQMVEKGLPVIIVAYDAFFNREGGPYQQLNGTDWPDNALRFGLLGYAAAWLGSHHNQQAWRPDIVHCNDWQTGLTPAYLRFWPGTNARCIMTIHNLAYQGVFDARFVSALQLPSESFKPQGLEYFGSLSFLKAGLFYSHYLTTVSPTYAREIQQETLGFGMQGLLRERRGVLKGILNGIDTQAWDSAQDPYLSQNYTAQSLDHKLQNKIALQQAMGLPVEARTPLVAIISRITPQKGSELVLNLMGDLAREGVQFVLLGSGDKNLEHSFQQLGHRHPDRVRVNIGYDEGLSHRIEAGADMFLMPSHFEPCGLNQMYSQRYGTPPIAHATGGLADTIVGASAENIATGQASGILFYDMHYPTVLAALRRAVQIFQTEPAIWRKLQSAGMARDFSWQKSAREYLKLYQSL